jgi:hypothetical protein
MTNDQSAPAFSKSRIEFFQAGVDKRYAAIDTTMRKQRIEDIFVKNESTVNSSAGFEGMVQCSVVEISQIATKPYQRFFIVH